MLLDIISYASNIYKSIGSSHTEHVYRNALCVEFMLKHISYESERTIPLEWKGYHIGVGRADIIVHPPNHKSIVLELKSVPNIKDAHISQLKSYMKTTNIKHGCVINFPKPCADDIQFSEYNIED